MPLQSEAERLLLIPSSTLTAIRPLGAGAFGEVFEAKWGELSVAVKITKQSADKLTLAREMDLLSHLPRADNLVTLHGYCTDHDDGNLRVVMELCPVGSVKS